MPWADPELSAPIACPTCGETRADRHEGRPLVPGFGMVGVRVFAWHCPQGHYVPLPSDGCYVLRRRDAGDQVVLLHRMGEERTGVDQLPFEGHVYEVSRQFMIMVCRKCKHIPTYEERVRLQEAKEAYYRRIDAGEDPALVNTVTLRFSRNADATIIGQSLDRGDGRVLATRTMGDPLWTLTQAGAAHFGIDFTWDTPEGVVLR